VSEEAEYLALLDAVVYVVYSREVAVFLCEVPYLDYRCRRTYLLSYLVATIVGGGKGI
jgi:hypothetical protein